MSFARFKCSRVVAWRIGILGAAAAVGIALAVVLWNGRTHLSTVVQRTPSAADIGFCQDMAAHHDQAVLMATFALDRAGPTVKAIAASILVTQSNETGMMRGWLQLWNRPPMAFTSVPNNQTNSGRYCLAPRRQGAMPGMASPKELNELWHISGASFDIRFLQLMIRHHQGGLMMLREAQATTTLDVVRSATKAMAVEQTQELAEMDRLLNALGGSLLTP